MGNRVSLSDFTHVARVRRRTVHSSGTLWFPSSKQSACLLKRASPETRYQSDLLILAIFGSRSRGQLNCHAKPGTHLGILQTSRIRAPFISLESGTHRLPQLMC